MYKLYIMLNLNSMINHWIRKTILSEDDLSVPILLSKHHDKIFDIAIKRNIHRNLLSPSYGSITYQIYAQHITFNSAYKLV